MQNGKEIIGPEEQSCAQYEQKDGVISGFCYGCGEGWEDYKTK